MREERDQARSERDQAQQERDRAQREKARLEQEAQRLREKIDELRKELEAAQRAARRQAAPYARGKRKKNPKSPGRKPGAKYGKQHNRPIPDHVDEEITVAAPEKCPGCGGPLTLERMEEQYQEEIVRRTFCGASTSPSAGVRVASNGYKVGIRCKPPMRWGRQRCKWARGIDPGRDDE